MPWVCCVIFRREWRLQIAIYLVFRMSLRYIRNNYYNGYVLWAKPNSGEGDEWCHRPGRLIVVGGLDRNSGECGLLRGVIVQIAALVMTQVFVWLRTC